MSRDSGNAFAAASLAVSPRHVQGTFSGDVSVLDTGKWEWTDLSAAAAKVNSDKPKARADTQLVYDPYVRSQGVRVLHSTLASASFPAARASASFSLAAGPTAGWAMPGPLTWLESLAPRTPCYACSRRSVPSRVGRTWRLSARASKWALGPRCASFRERSLSRRLARARLLPQSLCRRRPTNTCVSLLHAL